MKQLTPKEVLRHYKKRGLPENFCPVPFSTLLFEANGNACACRRKGSDDAVGDMRKESVWDIWNGKTMRKIRREFMDGKPEYCKVEVARDRCHLAADNADMLAHIEVAEVQKRPPLRISPNFNGHCNLECKMCHIWEYPNGTYDKIGFWEVLEKEILPHLVEIDTFSGEPFVQKDTYRLMEMAERINPNIIWCFTSNVNWKLTESLKKRLDKLKTKTFNVSIDSLEEKTYAEIRRKGDLRLALQTFNDLLDYDQDRQDRGLTSLGLVLHVVLQKDNWKELPAFLDLRRKTGVKLHLKFLDVPAELSMHRFSAAKKGAILQYYLDHIRPEELKMVGKIAKPLLAGLEPLERAAFISTYRERASL